MGLPWFTSKQGILVHEGVKALEQNASLWAKIKQNKAPIGDGFIILSAVIATCGDAACLKAAGPLLIIGGILKAAGVLPADADAKARALGVTIAGARPAIEGAIPAIEDIAAAVHDLIQPKIDLQLAVHKDETVAAAVKAAQGAGIQTTINVSSPSAGPPAITTGSAGA